MSGPVEQAERHAFEELARVLDSHYRKLHEALSDSWGDVDERRFVDSGTTLTIQPQSENPFRVDLILGYAAVGANQGAMLELGTEHKMVFAPNPAGSVVINIQCKLMLTHTDLRRLSVVTLTNGNPGPAGSGTAGYLYLHLGGREVPRGAIKW